MPAPEGWERQQRWTFIILALIFVVAPVVLSYLLGD